MRNFETAIGYSQVRVEKLLYEASAHIDMMNEFIQKEKVITNCMNMFLIEESHCVCHCWVPEHMMDTVDDIIRATEQ